MSRPRSAGNVERERGGPLPNFFIIGAPNSGTTSLWALLRQHPEVYMPDVKEPRFFSRDDLDEAREWYESLFADATTESAIGEASPNYSETHIWPSVPANVHRYCPQARLIYIVRHPFTRMESCWRQALYTGHWRRRVHGPRRMPLSFNRAVVEYPHFLGTCMYWRHLSAYRSYFPDDQILVLFFEDFEREPERVLRRCFEFLGVRGDVQVPQARHRWNPSSGKRMLRPSVWVLSSIPGLRKTKYLLPRPLRRLVGEKLFHKPVPTTVRWAENTRAVAAERLRDDVHKLLEFCGKPPDFWPLDGTAVESR